MRPLLLKLRGFTAFRDEAELDFSQLDLFAICGPTGSGKSSLLDAITYALYGLVERVGRQVSQLVSQGQNRLYVIFEFEVGGDRYRVSRNTPRGPGSTKVMMERRNGEEWEQAGEGSDKVGEVNKKIERLLGLDYEAFTRSVLLPQGKFAEFLVGDPKTRRDILTELLGLELFTRMAKRAGEIARADGEKAKTMAELLEREYEGVTEDALAAARAAVEEATSREESLTKADERVKEIAERWRAAQTTVDALRGCARDAREMAAIFGDGATRLAENAARAAQLRASVEASAKAALKAAVAAASASGAREKAEQEWGRVRELYELRATAIGIDEGRTTLLGKERELTTAREAEPARDSALNAATEAARVAKDAHEAAQRAVDEALERYREQQQLNAIATACQGLHVGDTCPICGGTVAALPDVDTAALDALVADGKRLRAEAERLDKSVRQAERARDSAERDLAEVRKELARLDAELTKQRDALAASSVALADAFGGSVPDDAVATLTMRIEALEGLSTKEQATAADANAAELATRDAQTALTKAEADATNERARLQAQPVASLASRAAEVSTATVTIEVIELPDDLAALTPVAASVAEALTSAADQLERKAEDHGQGEAALLREATDIVGDLLAPAASFANLLNDLTAAARKATSDCATSRAQVETLTERLQKRASMQADVITLHDRSALFKHLATELRADRLIAFLQGEALELLCEAGTAHLGRVSDGRYRLLYEDDEFLVCDTWNGDEKRSVRTLSGGETFLTSLALALALSEQVQSLAVTQKARLDSLFLDEGFGSLDPGSLQIVEDALSQLGADGRMVGVITHISGLAERLPARILVEKSQRGSTLSLST